MASMLGPLLTIAGAIIAMMGVYGPVAARKSRPRDGAAENDIVLRSGMWIGTGLILFCLGLFIA